MDEQALILRLQTGERQALEEIIQGYTHYLTAGGNCPEPGLQQAAKPPGDRGDPKPPPRQPPRPRGAV